MKKRGEKHRVTLAAIAAWKAGDYLALHDALNLAPWEASPLPTSTTALGVAEGMRDRPRHNGAGTLMEQSVPLALELQRELVEAAGWPEQ